MEFIRDAIEWVANETLGFGAGLFPFLMLGLVGLYVLWLVLGYLRVSQVGIDEGRERQQVIALPSDQDAEADVERPRGVPVCPVDGLQYPAGARFCTRCERDLVIDCANCGATLNAADASCYRCGTPTGSSQPALPG
jgi:hypothetical protein